MRGERRRRCCGLERGLGLWDRGLADSQARVQRRRRGLADSGQQSREDVSEWPQCDRRAGNFFFLSSPSRMLGVRLRGWRG